jgi:hypothetical protein
MLQNSYSFDRFLKVAGNLMKKTAKIFNPSWFGSSFITALAVF